MIKIEAIVRPERARNVLEALAEQGIHGATVYEVRGSGRQRGFVEHYRGLELRVNVLPKVKIEVVVKESRLEEAVEAIKLSARTGNVGDGLIFLSPVIDVIRIRTGERGQEVIADIESAPGEMER